MDTLVHVSTSLQTAIPWPPFGPRDVYPGGISVFLGRWYLEEVHACLKSGSGDMCAGNSGILGSQGMVWKRFLDSRAVESGLGGAFWSARLRAGTCLLMFQSGCVVYHCCLTYIVFIKPCPHYKFKYIVAIPPGKPSTPTTVLL